VAFNILLRDDTLLNIVQGVARRVGFATTVADAAGSTDPAIIQMVVAVNDAMADMLGEFQWPDFVTKSNISIIADAPGQVEKAFDLPADFFSFIQRTQNDRTSIWPAYTSVNPQAWQALQTIAVGINVQVMWRYKLGQFWVLYPPSVAHNFQFEYLSCGYIKDATDPTILKNFADKNGDIIRFDPYLVQLYAVAKWKEIKGFDTTTAMAAFARAYDQRYNRQQTAEVVSMIAGCPPANDLHLIDASNLPITGYAGVVS